MNYRRTSSDEISEGTSGEPAPDRLEVVNLLDPPTEFVKQSSDSIEPSRTHLDKDRAREHDRNQRIRVRLSVNERPGYPILSARAEDADDSDRGLLRYAWEPAFEPRPGRGSHGAVWGQTSEHNGMLQRKTTDEADEYKRGEKRHRKKLADQGQVEEKGDQASEEEKKDDDEEMNGSEDSLQQSYFGEKLESSLEDGEAETARGQHGQLPDGTFSMEEDTGVLRLMRPLRPEEAATNYLVMLLVRDSGQPPRSAQKVSLRVVGHGG
ncbi:unnamed protein product [Protopolystoma xenopodis]|uniref:Cadherin domain-containing protein n=1 Tax=Protopolystoma xenopodis TaxID=117903 RepID=A0A3S5A352_9PLAT|nr:unnamed protein product [Protopolystoma xenopodis]